MKERRLVMIATLMLMIGCLFFAGQIVLGLVGISLRPLPWQVYEALEILSACALGIGVFLGFRQYRHTTRERRRAETALRQASSAFGDLLQRRFDDWGLSPAEADVALFLIKGMSTAEIAKLRGSSEGTVKAQNAAIYRKAGVSGKTQLLSGFIEDLFEN